MKYILPFVLLGLIISACKKEQKATMTEPVAKNTVTTSSFGTLPDNTAVTLYTLRNKNGVEMKVMNYGGIIVSIKTPDKQGNLADVVLGFDSLSHYVKGNPYFGALIGRYGNRIARGKFSIDETAYTLATNNRPNHLHGGIKGFDKVFWNIEVLPDSSSLKLTYTSKDGEEGYPGTLNVEVIYTLTDNNEVKIDYTATTDKKTVVNLTNHTYFNLTGNLTNDILGHQLTLNADQFLPVDRALIPTGELKAVAGTPFDFTSPTVVGTRINDKDEQLGFGKGYDHCWVLKDYAQGTVRKVAELYEPQSGRVMEVSTDEPGIQFYSGNFLDGMLKGKGGEIIKFRTGLCLETQHFPDSPNKPAFPSVLLSPGETYKTSTVYKFSAR